MSENKPMLAPREKSRMYIAMEYVDGRSLRSVIQSDAPLPDERALEIARQIPELDALVVEQWVRGQAGEFQPRVGVRPVAFVGGERLMVGGLEIRANERR